MKKRSNALRSAHKQKEGAVGQGQD